ncbi:MAG: preprotein translocase subunit SecY [Candidatus Cloacimonetes bacterium]|nr:preprotein translocase subunit SecY [Candidatus Cloacimonadota bacterium]MCF7814340.1 preprotein translocase subunit SecY [Candidatus Cloacimonadota bacterium]MCF7868968.1 preprotein translocase subunit SecY [Candidatus Cloacimonadota bacterium]MCF7884362.1 preprotein translocase subunit SecY [Candidatus Cloacimonadota bacterium]
MLKSISNIFKIPDLKKKVLFTALILVIYRLGSFIPIPGINASALREFLGSASKSGGNLFGMFDLFVGGNLGRASVFALGIMPYITTSIVIQLLGGVIPFFERLKKEGAEGQKKIAQYTRYGTVFIAAFNAIGISVFLQSGVEGAVPHPGPLFLFTSVITMVTGVMFIMWLGEQITEKGIGNGISLIIFAGIIARYPKGFMQMFEMVRAGAMDIFLAVAVLVVMVLVTASVVLVTEGQRKIPVQYAKRIVGRKVYGGQSTHIPLKVNTAGVIPIIFAQAILMFPRTIATFFKDSDFMNSIVQVLSPGAWLYTVLYVTLIVFFAYFYTAMVMNPIEMAENMKKYGGFIPGRKPGKRTSDYINSVLVRITLPGALFFAFVAVLPEFMSKWANLPFYFGGTGLIIIVGVALDTLQQIESHLVMRHYEGFMKKGKLRGRRG